MDASGRGAAGEGTYGPVRGPCMLLGVLLLVTLAGTLPIAPAFGLHMAYGSFVGQLLAAVMVLLALSALRLRPGPTLGLAAPPGRLVWLVTGLAVGNLAAAGWLSGLVVEALFTPEEVFEQSRSMLSSLITTDTAGEAIWLALVFVVGAPLFEELLYRGLLQNLLGRWWRPWVAIAVTVVVFTLMHWVPVRFPLVLELAVLLSLLYHASGSFWLVVLLHAVTNGLARLAWHVPPLMQAFFSPWGAALGAIVAVGCGVGLVRALRATGPESAAPPPRRLRWGRFLAGSAMAGAVALALGFLAGPLAGPGARELADRRPDYRVALRDAGRAWRTLAGWMAFEAVVSTVRGAVKEGDVAVDEFVTWIEEVAAGMPDELTPAGGGHGEEVLAEDPLPVEREVLDRLRAGVRERFGLEVEDPPPLF